MLFFKRKYKTNLLMMLSLMGIKTAKQRLLVTAVMRGTNWTGPR